MEKSGKMFSDSLNELKEVRNVVVCALFAAIAVVLGYFTIVLGPFVKIGFSGIPNQLIAALFGPVIGGLFGGALDIFKFIIGPTGVFFPGFTFNAILAGVIYGCFFYKKKISIWRIFLAHFVVIVIVNLGLTTYWLSILYGKGFFAIFPLRVLKNLIMWPIESTILFTVMKTMDIAIKPYLSKSFTKVRTTLKSK